MRDPQSRNCDRCGEQKPAPSAGWKLVFLKADLESAYSKAIVFSLCPECAVSFRHWLTTS